MTNFARPLFVPKYKDNLNFKHVRLVGNITESPSRKTGSPDNFQKYNDQDEILVYDDLIFSLNARKNEIKNLMGQNTSITYSFPKNGIVIPCYNEHDRLETEQFKTFIESHPDYLLCFVNDGSSDGTLSVLNKLRIAHKEQVIVVDCLKNKGKAEAVRAGINYIKRYTRIEHFGFLDADLSTDFEDLKNLVYTIEKSEFGIVSGSRIERMGANIQRKSSRSVISKSINMMINTILKLNFQDTQCGAKVMTRQIINQTFAKPFKTKWLFDVEIFQRMNASFGLERSSSMICEQPLKRWIHRDGSNLGFKDSLKIFKELVKIAFNK